MRPRFLLAWVGWDINRWHLPHPFAKIRTIRHTKLRYTWRCCLEGLELAHLLVDSLLEKKGSDILLLDIREQAAFADYFLLCNGENTPQLKALAENVTLDAKQEAEVRALGYEGDAEDGWMLIDFGDLVVHLFSPEKRAYYNLETLWDDAHVVMRMQ